MCVYAGLLYINQQKGLIFFEGFCWLILSDSRFFRGSFIANPGEGGSKGNLISCWASKNMRGSRCSCLCRDLTVEVSRFAKHEWLDIPHTIHVWHIYIIYLHLPQKSTKNQPSTYSKYISHMNPNRWFQQLTYFGGEVSPPGEDEPNLTVAHI